MSFSHPLVRSGGNEIVKQLILCPRAFNKKGFIWYPKRSKAACPPPRWSKHQANNYPKSCKNHSKIMDQNLSKINPKSTKNQYKINQKSTQNRLKIDQKSTKNRPGAKNVAHFVLGAVLEASWRRLGGV